MSINSSLGIKSNIELTNTKVVLNIQMKMLIIIEVSDGILLSPAQIDNIVIYYNIRADRSSFTRIPSVILSSTLNNVHEEQIKRKLNILKSAVAATACLNP